MDGACGQPARWDTWRAAEGAIGRKEALANAASGLPPRQALLLRSMDALERGEREDLVALCRAAREVEQHDLAEVLEIVLADAADLDPSQVRKRAKRRGLRNGDDFPLLDLLRLLAVKLSGARPTRPQSLADAARERPVLQALLPALSRKFAAFKLHRRLEPLSPRLAAYWAVAIARATRQTDARALLRELLPWSSHAFPARDWPDLDEHEPRRRGFEHWLASSPPGPWHKSFEGELYALWGAPCAARRRALGLLLARIDDVLRLGRPEDALPPIHAALRLVEATEGLEDAAGLSLQLSHLEERLRWFLPVGERSAALAQALWRDARDAPPPERNAIARELLEKLGAEDLPRHARSELVSALVIDQSDASERCSALWRHARDTDAGELDAALSRAGRGELERLVIQGELAIAREQWGRALDCAARLAEREGGLEDASRIAVMALECARTVRLARRERRRLEDVLRAAERGTPPLGLALVLPGILRNQFPPPEAEAWRGRLAPAVVRAAGPPRETPTPRCAFEAAALAGAGEVELARERFRPLGRELRRRADEPATWDLALRSLDALCSLRAQQRAGSLVEEWCGSLGAFLLHRGPEHLAPRVAALARADEPGLGIGLVAWMAEHERELGGHPAFEAFALAVKARAAARGLQEDGDDEDELDACELDSLPGDLTVDNLEAILEGLLSGEEGPF